MPCDAVEEAAANRNDSEMSQLSAWIFRFCAPTSEPLAQHSDSLVKVSAKLAHQSDMLRRAFRSLTSAH